MISRVESAPRVDQGPVTIKTRVINRAPSREIQDLTTLVPYLYESTSTRSFLCSNTSLNFLGALLVQKALPEMVAAFSDKKLSPITKSPTELRHGVQLCINSIQGTELNIRVDNVLIKQAAGSNAGVVLSGPYAGLLLETYYDDINTHKKAVSRMWNDDVGVDLPYEVNVSDEKGARFEDAYAIYRKHRTALFDPSNPDATITQKFFALCKELNLPIDTEAFQYTQPVKK